MIKVFTLNKNGKIELTKIELEQLLNESYWEGYRSYNSWTYSSPSPSPYSCKDWTVTVTNTATNKPYTFLNSISSSDSDSITLKTNQDNSREVPRR